MNKRHIFISAAMSGILLLSACGSSENATTSKVGNITQNELNKELKEKYGKVTLHQMMASKALLDIYKVSDDEVKKQVEKTKEQLGDKFNAALAQSGLKNEKEFQERIKPKIALEKGIKETVTEKDLKDNYKPKLTTSHILVKDEKTAKEIKEKLNNGEDFAALAKQYSEDPRSKEKGGELPMFGPGQMDPKFEETAYKLEVGQASDVVQSSHGYHIIKLTEKKELKSFEEEKENIRKELETQRLQDRSGKWQQKVVNDALKKADIKVTDQDLKDTFKDVQNKNIV
ncbi:peptidylprolyl isomerase [Bacillus paramycoides]|uniref:peptidylprolyl isomerase n=1 Tax=Bacillus paramycoides TaxID=2026194 RepID=UPI0015C1A5BA|nr:peptidylprolyl isomerase [Bacillus paramycoides]NWK72593.1 peptidylprolyl isomerase [Bacillus paramycoides]